MTSLIAIVGRPNVGKSTLFNRLTGRRRALVADFPGLTRDRQYGSAVLDERNCWLVDTGGWGHPEQGLAEPVAGQTWRAVEEASVVVLVVDARQGLTAEDEALAGRLRREGKPVVLAVNKVDGLDAMIATAEFHRLGLGLPYPVSATHGRGMAQLAEALARALPPEPEAGRVPDEGIRIAVIGRPNVGKSTLVNRLLGQDRVVTADQPGTTRDSVYVPFERFGRRYTLIDTAGLRRRARVVEAVERFSAIKTLQALEEAHVAILVLDARQGIAAQDATLLSWAAERGKALVLAINKWDGLSPGEREQARREIDRRLTFIDYAPAHFISALHGSGVGELLASVERAYLSATRELSTSELTRILQDVVRDHAPPTVRGRRIKLRYAHQGGQNPPVIVIHGNQTDAVPQDYRRYLARRFREALGLEGTPVRVAFKTGVNPFKGRKNVLTARQVRKRKRLLRHVK